LFSYFLRCWTNPALMMSACAAAATFAAATFCCHPRRGADLLQKLVNPDAARPAVDLERPALVAALTALLLGDQVRCSLLQCAAKARLIPDSKSACVMFAVCGQPVFWCCGRHLLALIDVKIVYCVGLERPALVAALTALLLGDQVRCWAAAGAAVGAAAGAAAGLLLALLNCAELC
jgi:hypothetical protein